MKKQLLTLLALVTLGHGATYYSNTQPQSVPKSVAAGPFSFLVADVQLGNPANTSTDTAYSTAYDMINLPMIVVDSLGQKMKVDTTIGTFITSCYDINDSAAATDTVQVTTTIQQKLYAADGVSPLSAKSPAWDSVGAITLNAASDANAIVQGTLRPTLYTADHRFVRVRLVNIKNNKKDIPRCRVYWQRRNYLR